MSIEYVVGLPCAPKEALTVGGMVTLLKNRGQARSIVEHFRRRGDQRPVEELSFKRVVMRPSGPVEETVSVGDMLSRAQSLQTHAHHCAGCHADVGGEPYGCYGAISYPITGRGEGWLMSLLPDDIDAPAGHFLRSAVTDLKYTGGMFLKMRPNPTFFENRGPLVRDWGSWSITSDQLLHMLFGLGNLQPSHCRMLCLILGLIQVGDTRKPLPQATAGDQSEQFARAVNAVARASRLGVELLVDA